MRLEHSNDGKPAAVRNAHKTCTAVVVRNVFHEPVDGVVGVRAFVDRLRILRIANRSLHHKSSFGAVAAANILKDKDVVVGNPLGIAPEDATVTIVIVLQSIRGSLDDDG